VAGGGNRVRGAGVVGCGVLGAAEAALTTGRRLWERRYAGLVLAAACLLAVLCCLAAYEWDNKYTAAEPRGNAGVLVLTEQDLASHPVVPLVSGWEYYADKLLAPGDVVGATPDATVFIGEYGGFDAGGRSASPHGSATYRLVIELPEHRAQYLLELPEIFSAYRAWVNSELVAEMGDPYPQTYRPETKTRTVQFDAASKVELLIAVSDWSHLYSGMTYPPLFGTPEAVFAVASARLVVRAVIDAFALAIGALALLVGILSRRASLATRYGLLCVFFTGTTAYPLVKELAGSFYPLYLIENLSFNAMLLVAVLLQGAILRTRGRWERGFAGFGGLVLAASVALPFALQSHDLWVVAGYSALATAYQWVTAAFLTVGAVVALWGGRASALALAVGMIAFDTTLVMDRLLPWHEPLITGWFYELGSFALVGCIGVVVARDLAASYRENLVLAERMDSLTRLTRLQEQNYHLMEARITEAKAARHDLRHHLIAISRLLDGGHLDKLAAYVRNIAAPDPQPIEYSRNQVVNVLLGHFGALAEQSGVSLRLSLNVEPSLGLPDPDLATVVSNLLENALEACSRTPAGERWINVTMTQKPSLLAISLENSAHAAPPTREGGFGSSKAPGRKGYGLDSIRLVAVRLGGDADFSYDPAARVFRSTVLLPLHPPA
jgi:hypothetical protein